MKKILGLCLVLGLVGCASPSYNSSGPVVTEQISRPEIGAITTSGVGEELLFQGNKSEDEVLKIKKELKFGGYVIPAGQYTKKGFNDKGIYFSTTNKRDGNARSVSIFSDPAQVLMVDPNHRLCVVTIYNTKSCSSNGEFVLEKITALSENTFQQTLIYNGKVGNKINIGYREFSGDIARPAFNNDVEYDLSESKQIGYKGALLEIIDATNQSIKYKVLKNFNKAR